jgi:hypothetical protein
MPIGALTAWRFTSWRSAPSDLRTGQPIVPFDLRVGTTAGYYFA